MKSAYELALERMAAQGIEPPRERLADEAAQRELEEVRQRAQADLAQLEILHAERKKESPHSPELDQEYRAERERIEARRERKIREIRARYSDDGA